MPKCDFNKVVKHIFGGAIVRGAIIQGELS